MAVCLNRRQLGRPVRPRASTRDRRAAAFPGDERGNLLLISGVLLVLGFLVLGSTLVHLNSLEGSTARVQRDGIVLDMEALMEDLQKSLYDSVLVGDTNVTDFESVMRNLERGLIDSAARSGIYVALVPTTENPDIWRRADRCLGYNIDATQRGVVVGWTEDDLEETIAGVVYQVHATDGRQSFQFHFYALIERCAANEITSVFTAITMHLGSVSDAVAMKSPGAAARFQEERDLNTKVLVVFHPTIDRDTVVVQGNWNNVDKLHQLDGTYTTMSSNLASLVTQGNHFRFKLDPPPLMKPGDTLPNVTLEITGYKNLGWSLLAPQSMYLQIYPLGALVPTVIKEIPFKVGASNADTHHMVIPELVPLRGHWTYGDLTNSLWELKVIGAHQPSQHWNIDHFNMTGGMMMSPLRVDAVMAWQPIPPSYGEHVIEMRYRVAEERTVGEGFLLQALDAELDAWVDVTEMTYTNGDWVDFSVAVADLGVSVDSWAQAHLRFVDTKDDDYFVPEDQDAFEVDLLRIVSHLQN